jgi:uncharacterized protein (TIGR04222 family)
MGAEGLMAMNRLWGISGPLFLALYGAGLVVAFAWAVSLRWRVRRPPEPAPGQQLGVAELGYLTGGPHLAVGAVVAQLVESGRVRLSRGGFASAVPTTGADPVEAAVLREIDGTPRLAGTVIHNAADSPAVLAVRDGLVRHGLLVAPAAARAARLRGVAVLGLLAAVGVVRHVVAVRQLQPVGYLTLLLILTVVLAVVLHRRPVKATTVHGDRLLASVHRTGPDRLNPWLRPSVTGAGRTVALFGLDAYPDAAVRRDLVHSAVMIGMVTSVGPYW